MRKLSVDDVETIKITITEMLDTRYDLEYYIDHLYDVPDSFKESVSKLIGVLHELEQIVDEDFN